MATTLAERERRVTHQVQWFRRSLLIHFSYEAVSALCAGTAGTYKVQASLMEVDQVLFDSVSRLLVNTVEKIKITSAKKID